MPRPCSITVCEEVIPDTARETTLYCSQCRGSMGAWIKRPAAHILRRKTNLAKYSERMETLSTKEKRREAKRRK